MGRLRKGEPAKPNRQDAERAISRYIDGFYNPVRRHSAPDFTSPAKFEKMATD
jgi:transposase InsO family protein